MAKTFPSLRFDSALKTYFYLKFAHRMRIGLQPVSLPPFGIAEGITEGCMQLFPQGTRQVGMHLSCGAMGEEEFRACRELMYDAANGVCQCSGRPEYREMQPEWKNSRLPFFRTVCSPRLPLQANGRDKSISKKDRRNVM